MKRDGLRITRREIQIVLGLLWMLDGFLQVLAGSGSSRAAA